MQADLPLALTQPWLQALAPTRAAALERVARRCAAGCMRTKREQQIVAGATEFFARPRPGRADARAGRRDRHRAHPAVPLLPHQAGTDRTCLRRHHRRPLGRTLGGPARRPEAPVADKLLAFYRDYLPPSSRPIGLRILVYSGLSDGLIPGRYFAMVRERLFPRLLREPARAAGSRSRAKATAARRSAVDGLSRRAHLPPGHLAADLPADLHRPGRCRADRHSSPIASRASWHRCPR